MARFAVIFVALCGLLLAGCSDVSDREERAWRLWEMATDTASGVFIKVQGTLASLLERGSEAKESITKTVEDLEHRAAQVEEGIESLKKGQELLREGLTRE